MKNEWNKERVLDGILWLATADALGVPVEFNKREKLKHDPDCAAADLDYDGITENFVHWRENSAFTPYGVCFDCGITSGQAIMRYQSGTKSLDCGGTGERDNGNGSLMRILPIVYYLYARYGNGLAEQPESFDVADLNFCPRVAHDICRNLLTAFAV